MFLEDAMKQVRESFDPVKACTKGFYRGGHMVPAEIITLLPGSVAGSLHLELADAQDGFFSVCKVYGDGKYAEHPEDAMKFMNETIANMGVATERFTAAYEVLKQHGTTNPNDIAAIGYCFGGAVVLHMARFGVDLDGVVSFHGNLATEAPAKKGAVKSKLLVLHGAADPMVPPDQVAAFKKEMDTAEVDYIFIAYPNAKHAFTDQAATEKGKKHEMPLEYNAKADQQSWAEMTKFLEQLFPPS